MRNIIAGVAGVVTLCAFCSALGSTDSVRVFVKETAMDSVVHYTYRILKPVSFDITSFELGHGKSAQPFLRELPVGFDLKSIMYADFSLFSKKNPTGWTSAIGVQEESDFHWMEWHLSEGKSNVGKAELVGFSFSLPKQDDTYVTSKLVVYNSAAEFSSRETEVAVEREPTTPVESEKFLLSAVKRFSPNAKEPAVKSLKGNIFFAIPSKIPVTTGNGGNGQSVLKFKPVGQTSEVSCTYKGSASRAKPVATADTDSGKEYRFVKCSDGRVAGDIATAGWIKLEIKGAVNGGKKSFVQANFEVVPLK